MTPVPRGPLRVAVLLDAPVVPAWLHRALWDVVHSGSAELVMAVLRRAPARKALVREAGFRAYEALDRRFFSFPQDHAAPIDASVLLERCPQLRADPIREGARTQLSSEPLEAIRAQRPDLVLKLGFPPLEGGILDVAPLGVWSFDHLEREAGEGAPAFFWEIARGCAVTETCLRATDARGSRVLQRSFAATDRSSLHRSRNAALWKTADFVSRALRDAGEGVAPRDEGLPPPPGSAPRRVPHALDLLRFVVRGASRVIRERRRRRREDYLWFVALRRAGASLVDGSFEGFRPLQPPAGRFQADPFLVSEGGRHWLFLEDADLVGHKGVIRCAELREDGSQGESRVVLERDYHLSYPFVFPWHGEYYMLPETLENRTIELWRATHFPWRWSLEKVLFHDVAAVDPTLLQHAGRVWLFANQSVSGGSLHDELFLYSADSLLGEWHAHPRNPVVSDVRRARPAGRLFLEAGQLYRPAQDCGEEYGSGIWIHRVDTLDLRDYRETPVRRIGAGWWPGASCTHTLERVGGFDAIDARVWLPRGARLV